jgi:hypothetical protein
VAITQGRAQAIQRRAPPRAPAPRRARRKRRTYYKGMAVFTATKGGLMYEASIGGQKFGYKPKK